MITHESALEALSDGRGKDAFDYLADLCLLPYNAVQKAQEIDLRWELRMWKLHAEVPGVIPVSDGIQEVLL